MRAEDVEHKTVEIKVGTTLKEAERLLVLATLEAYKSKKAAAKVLGISRTSLYAKLERITGRPVEESSDQGRPLPEADRQDVGVEGQGPVDAVGEAPTTPT